MKNIQVIDSAVNCTYDIYSISDAEFVELFPNDTDIQFIEDVFADLGDKRGQEILNSIWNNRVDKKQVSGIHGTLFYGLAEEKRRYYPTKKESEMIANP